MIYGATGNVPPLYFLQILLVLILFHFCLLYTKFIKCAEMYMLTDGSTDYRDTWSFLDRRFDDYENLTQVRVQV